MKIETETKFNIGDKVFVVYEDSINNDYYCTETGLFITDKVVINDIILIAKKDKPVCIQYNVQGFNCYFNEVVLFYNSKDAKKYIKADLKKKVVGTNEKIKFKFYYRIKE